MPVGRDFVLPQRQPFPHGDAQLPLHEVDARDHLGHGMLDLQARVHLDEMETGCIRDEFDRPGADIARDLRGGARRSRGMYCSIRTWSLPNEAAASRLALAIASASASALATRRIPLPPPPADALTRTG